VHIKNLKEKDYLEYVGGDVSTILKWISVEYNVKVLCGFSWLKIGFN
jgi:hypothetical protein